jgi:hypothetical protein
MTLRLENIERLHIGLLVLAIALALWTGWLGPWSLTLGAAVMGLNMWILRQLFARVFAAGGVQSAPVVIALTTLQFVLFLGLLIALFWRVPLDPISFAVGATLLLIACVVEALRCPPAFSEGGEVDAL